MAQLKSRTQTPAPSSAPAALPLAQAPLPPPQLFDILPPLHALLSRLEPSLSTYTPDTPVVSTPSQPQVSFATTTSTNTNGSAAIGGGQQLNYKDAAVAAQFLKTRIRKVQVELGKLDDMDRTVEEQEDEIVELERRIAGQREVLGKLGRVAGDMLEGSEMKDG